MKIFSLETGLFKLDGGAMFGVVPKVLWEKVYPADELNRCTYTMRCMLVDNGKNIVLIDSGIGNKQDEKFLTNFGLFGNDSLLNSIQNAGYKPEDITDVVHTHLHFDHCGGTISKNEQGKFVPAFPNAKIWVSRKHWEEATNPNPRERASFLKENILPMQESGKLNLVDEEIELFENFHIRFANGHTIGQIVVFINFNGRWILYGGDLFPLASLVYEPWIMSYDMNARQTLADKEKLFAEIHNKKAIVFFEHDYYQECAKLIKTEKGTKVEKTFSFSDFIENKY